MRKDKCQVLPQWESLVQGRSSTPLPRSSRLGASQDTVHTDPLAAEPSVPHTAPASPRCRRSSGQCHEPCCFVWGARYRASSGFLPEAMAGRANGVTSLERPAEPWQTPSARRARWSLLPLFSRGSKCLGLDTSQRLVNKLRPVKRWQSKYCHDCLQRLQGPRPHRGCDPSEPRSWC